MCKQIKNNQIRLRNLPFKILKDTGVPAVMVSTKKARKFGEKLKWQVKCKKKVFISDHFVTHYRINLLDNQSESGTPVKAPLTF